MADEGLQSAGTGLFLQCDVHGRVEWMGDVYCRSCKEVYVCAGVAVDASGRQQRIYPTAPPKGMCTAKCGKRLFGGSDFSMRPMCNECATAVAARKAETK